NSTPGRLGFIFLGRDWVYVVLILPGLGLDRAGRDGDDAVNCSPLPEGHRFGRRRRRVIGCRGSAGKARGRAPTQRVPLARRVPPAAVSLRRFDYSSASG